MSPSWILPLLLAIDPGNEQSAYVLLETATYRPARFGKLPNLDLLDLLNKELLRDAEQVAIEQIGHYGTGMPAGASVFDTCRWIGRFEQVISEDSHLSEPLLVKRATVKTHLCGTAKAKDGNVIQALIDRFASGTPNRGKGIKSAPGFFYGFHADIWQAMALAVYAADILNTPECN